MHMACEDKQAVNVLHFTMPQRQDIKLLEQVEHGQPSLHISFDCRNKDECISH